MTVVHQLVPSVVPYDATSGHTLQVQQALRQAGYESEIYAQAIHPAFEDRVRLIDELRGPQRRDGHLLLQFSSVSALGDIALGRRERLALDYHNVTPPHFFRAWSRSIAHHLRAGQLQLAQLARVAELGIGDSAFNTEDLRELGMPETAVVPVLVDVDDLLVPPDPTTTAELARRRRHGGALWLFVGSIAPHKAQHRLVQALAEYRKVYDGEARLVLVGRAVSTTYAAAVRQFVDALGLADVIELTGGVDQHRLAAYYAAADVFVSASGHEGFGVPLLEAMAHDVPVVARAAGAVAATVGDAGLLLNDAGASSMAATVARVLADSSLRSRLVAAGRVRLQHYSLVRSRATMVDTIGRWVSS